MPLRILIRQPYIYYYKSSILRECSCGEKLSRDENREMLLRLRDKVSSCDVDFVKCNLKCH